MLRRIAAGVALTVLAVSSPTLDPYAQAAPPARAHSPQRDALRWIGALWHWLGYSPTYTTPDGHTCAWGPLIERSFNSAGLNGPYMTDIAWRESRCTPGAVSPTSDFGLLQMHRPLNDPFFWRAGCDPTRALEPACNVSAAVALAQEAGRIWGDPYRPWRL